MEIQLFNTREMKILNVISPILQPSVKIISKKSIKRHSNRFKVIREIKNPTTIQIKL